MKWNKGFILSLFIVFIATLSINANAALMKTINGQVSSIDIEKAIIVLRFEHPATGEVRHLQFQIDNNTGFSDDLDLSQLKVNDPLSIDYEQVYEDILLARYVERVQLEGPPDGIEEFRGL